MRPSLDDMPPRGLVFDVDTFAVDDGPGIRLAVYLKGCPLRCRWCHSPESQRNYPELIFVADRCVGCGRCVSTCESGVHAIADGRHTLDRTVCVSCFRCVAGCPTKALQIKGDLVGADEVVARARRLRPFFEHSGGGITLTGGEVTAQADFAEAVLAGCRAAGIHTAIETCGAGPWETLRRLLDHTDLVLYDLKLIDDVLHREWTGASNRAILANARRLAGRSVRVRVPLIPGVTDTAANLRGLFGFAADAGLREVELLPANEAAAAKYEWLGRPYDVPHKPVADAQLAESIAHGRALGLELTGPAPPAAS